MQSVEFGDKKGKVLIDTVTTKVTSWTNTRITATVKKVPLPVGPYKVSISTKLATVSLPDLFTVKDPKLDPLTDANRDGIPGAEIVLTGRFFGTKKVYLEELSSGKKKSCKVTYWYMNPTTGASEIRFIVPKVSKSLTLGPHPLTIVNKRVGSKRKLRYRAPVSTNNTKGPGNNPGPFVFHPWHHHRVSRKECLYLSAFYSKYGLDIYYICDRMENTEGDIAGFHSLLTVEKDYSEKRRYKMMQSLERFYGKLIVVFVILFTVFFCSSLWAANIYVAPIGTGDGSISSPASLQDALDTANSTIGDHTLFL